MSGRKTKGRDSQRGAGSAGTIREGEGGKRRTENDLQSEDIKGE